MVCLVQSGFCEVNTTSSVTLNMGYDLLNVCVCVCVLFQTSIVDKKPKTEEKKEGKWQPDSQLECVKGFLVPGEYQYTSVGYTIIP